MSIDINQLVMKSVMENVEPVTEEYDTIKKLGASDGATVGKVKRGWDEYWGSAKDAYHDQQPSAMDKVKDVAGGAAEKVKDAASGAADKVKDAAGKVREVAADHPAAAGAAGAIGAGIGGFAMGKKYANRKKK